MKASFRSACLVVLLPAAVIFAAEAPPAKPEGRVGTPVEAPASAATGPTPRAVAPAATSVMPPSAGVAPAEPVATKVTSIQHDGQTFVLVNSTTNDRVATDEYVPSGEKLGTWTQLITVQRLHLAAATSPAALLTYVRGSVAAEQASVDVVEDSTGAAVFSVQFPQSERNEEQRMICLTLADPHDPAVLNVVQYAIKPTHFDAGEVATRVGSWRERFLAQARAVVPSTDDSAAKSSG